MTRSLVFFAAVLVLFARTCRGERPLDDADDTVSSEFDPCSLCGIEDMTSAGASSPFFVVVPDAERDPNEKRPFAFGAEATRRMNRDALAPKALGESGPDLDVDGGVVGMKDIWEAFAVWGGALDLLCGRDLSALPADRAFSFPSSIVSIPSAGCCEKYDGVLGVRNDEFFEGLPLLESVESVFAELYEDR